MKKVLLLVVAICFLGLGANAQDIFKKGDIVGNAHVGIGVAPSGYSMLLPPLTISAEYCIVDNLIKGNNGSIGVGALIGYAGYKYHDETNYSYYSYKVDTKYNRLCFGARGTFHYQFVDKLDTYAGVMLGLYSNTEKTKTETNNGFGTNTYEQPKESHASLAYSTFVGARYYFNDSFAVSSEIGYGFTLLSVGVSFKF